MRAAEVRALLGGAPVDAADGQPAARLRARPLPRRVRRLERERRGRAGRRPGAVRRDGAGRRGGRRVARRARRALTVAQGRHLACWAGRRERQHLGDLRVPRGAGKGLSVAAGTPAPRGRGLRPQPPRGAAGPAGGAAARRPRRPRHLPRRRARGADGRRPRRPPAASPSASSARWPPATTRPAASPRPWPSSSRRAPASSAPPAASASTPTPSPTGCGAPRSCSATPSPSASSSCASRCGWRGWCRVRPRPPHRCPGTDSRVSLRGAAPRGTS